MVTIMEQQNPVNPMVDFAKKVSPDEPYKLVLWDELKWVGFSRHFRGNGESIYLAALRDFLCSDESSMITHLNFGNNFYYTSLNAHINFNRIVDAIANSQYLQELHFGNNIIPLESMEPLSTALANNTKLRELSLTMNWPGFDKSSENIKFIPFLAKSLLRNVCLEKIDLSYNHIDEEGIKALATACEANQNLLEINLSHAKYVIEKSTYPEPPGRLKPYLARIKTALANNNTTFNAMAHFATPPDDKKQMTQANTVSHTNPSYESIQTLSLFGSHLPMQDDEISDTDSEADLSPNSKTLPYYRKRQKLQKKLQKKPKRIEPSPSDEKLLEYQKRPR
jgi:hypothetical protein